MEFRSVFDTIPEQFDRYRPRYCDKLFIDLIAIAEIAPEKTVLELGPGTGQATNPVLNTGCNYNAIELGPNLFKMMKHKKVKIWNLKKKAPNLALFFIIEIP